MQQLGNPCFFHLPRFRNSIAFWGGYPRLHPSCDTPVLGGPSFRHFGCLQKSWLFRQNLLENLMEFGAVLILRYPKNTGDDSIYLVLSKRTFFFFRIRWNNMCIVVYIYICIRKPMRSRWLQANSFLLQTPSAWAISVVTSYDFSVMPWRWNEIHFK